MNKLWVVCQKKTDNLVDQLLINRGIDLKDRKRFLNPRYEDLHDPFLLNGMKKAVARILQAIENQETIGIFADYDADGIPGAAILANFFRFLKVKVETYIPSREEGYGLNQAGILDLAEKGCKLIITVDLGVTGKKEVEFAKSLAIDVIVTDHHLMQKKMIPESALAIIHPQLSPKYPFKDLAGGAVAWKLACGLISKLTTNHPSIMLGAGEKLKTLEKWLLDLAAISTVCDIMPLTGENRIIVKYGLQVLTKSKNIGLQELMEVAGTDKTKISTYTLGFQIGPRINAPGRLDHAQISYFLLTTRDREEARELAKKLNSINKERQDELEKTTLEAKEKIKKLKLSEKKVIVLSDKNWPEGIIGLVAGRLMEELSRPVIIFKENEDGLKGSARSIEKFHILNALDKVNNLLTSHGGHARAAGLAIRKENYDNLYEKLLVMAEKDLTDMDLQPQIKIDTEIGIRKSKVRSQNSEIRGQKSDMRFQVSDLRTLVSDLRSIEPFGMGNPRPVFLTKRLAISDIRFMGKDNRHLKLKLTSYPLPLTPISAVMFNCSECHKGLQKGHIIDIVYTIEENEWQGNKSLQLKILDLKESE